MDRSHSDWCEMVPHCGFDLHFSAFGRNDAKAETPVLWPPHMKSWLIGKDCDAGRDWGQEENGTTEDEMAGWHHGLGGRESEWTPGVGDGQGSLACCDSWGCKESDMTEWLNWTELIMSDVEHLFMYLLAIYMSSLEKPPFIWPCKPPQRLQKDILSIYSHYGVNLNLHIQFRKTSNLLFIGYFYF